MMHMEAKRFGQAKCNNKENIYLENLWVLHHHRKSHYVGVNLSHRANQSLEGPALREALLDLE